METPGQGDPFETGAGGAVAEDDPFADVPADDVAAEVAAEPVGDAPAAPPAAEEPPTVDREGAPVEQPAAPPEEAPAPAEQPAAPAAAPEQPETPAEAPAAPSEPSAPAEPGTGDQGAPAPAEGQPQTGGEGAQASGPGSRGGKGEMRHYKVLYQTAERQWAEHPLTPVPQGVNVVTLDGESWIEARNNDHATRIAFAILGSPQDGVTVWPVPKGAFKPKRVKPAPPAPERTRLEIG